MDGECINQCPVPQYAQSGKCTDGTRTLVSESQLLQTNADGELIEDDSGSARLNSKVKDETEYLNEEQASKFYQQEAALLKFL